MRIALADNVEITEDISKSISFVGFDENQFSDDAFITITQNPSNGSLDNQEVIDVGVSEIAQWVMTYTPDSDFSGTDEIKFTVNKLVFFNA